MYSLQRIAELVDGRVEGQDISVSAIGNLQSSDKDCITFYADKKFKGLLPSCTAGAMLIRHADADLFTGNKILVDNPYLAYAKISSLFSPLSLSSNKKNVAAIDATAIIDDDCQIDCTVKVGKYSTIDSSTIIASNVVIGNGVRIANGVQIGCKHYH